MSLKLSHPLHSEMEDVVVAEDAELGLYAVIATHSTLLGPAICGTRLQAYRNADHALEDATLNARQATWRAALAKIPFGGACAAIRTPDDPNQRPQIMRAFGELLASFDGGLIASEDLGVDIDDMHAIGRATPFVCGGGKSKIGDPSYYTALGVLRAVESGVKHRFSADSLAELKVGIYGLGRVGFQLAEMLQLAQVKLYVSDICPENTNKARLELGATVCEPAELLSMKLDVLCPCAIGRLLDDASIPNLKCAIITGSSNNQIVRPHRHGRMLMQRGILYVPDFAVNSGGLYANACHIMDYDAARATILVNGIYDTVEMLIEQGAAQRRPPTDIAMAAVHDKLRRARKKRMMQYI